MARHFLPQSVAMSQEVDRLNALAKAAMNRREYGLAGSYEHAAIAIEACIPQQRTDEARDRAVAAVKAVAGYEVERTKP